MTNLSELDKLEAYLKEHDIKYERIDEDLYAGKLPPPLRDDEFFDGYGERHQIIVNSGEKREWDAICHWGSYGYEEGLLEIYGSLVDKAKFGDTDSVRGWLTAEEVIKRIEVK